MILKNLLTRYLMFTGIAAHVAVLGALLLAPEILITLGHKTQVKVEHTLGSLLPDTQAAPAVTWEQARASLSKWQPNNETLLDDGEILVDGISVQNLKEAAMRLRDSSLLEIGPGVYSTAMIINPDNVHIVGRGHVVFDGAVTAGKGTFVIDGSDTTVENIECRNVEVPDANGACIRLQGKNLDLEHVYFHSSQQGLLTGATPGHVTIHRSFFERLGYRGQAHGVYQGGGTLTIDRSYFLASKSEGHEIKSRATRTTITRSVVAALNGMDSRLIDVSNGGIVSITDNTLQQGPNSQNWDLIGFALEGDRHDNNALTVRRNLIIMERSGGNNLLHSKATGTIPNISDNVIISPRKTDYAAANAEFRTRKAARLPAYPAIPELPL